VLRAVSEEYRRGRARLRKTPGDKTAVPVERYAFTAASGAPGWQTQRGAHAETTSVPLRRRRRSQQISALTLPLAERGRRVAAALSAVTPAVLAGITYRLVLVAGTAMLLAGLLRIQEVFGGATDAAMPAWSEHLRWLEVLWLAPLPLALGLWLGWLIWGEPARRAPCGVAVPRLPSGDPVLLVFRFCARGQNVEVLRESVAAVRRAFAEYDVLGARYRIEVVSERALDLDGGVEVYIVPPTYAPPHGARFKARALTYLQAVTQPDPAAWHVYLDEESCVDARALAGIYAFVTHALRRAQRHHLSTPRLIGQGAILYEGGSAFFRGADALRTGDDLGRFRLQYALGAPIFGAHGSYLVVRGAEEPALSFDVGPANSITEDAAWALRAWARGWRFGWVRGYVHEQPPQRATDFIRQRARWLTGIRHVVRDASIPLRFRAILFGFVVLWHLSVLPLGIAIVALVTQTEPFTWARLPADFAWTAFVLAYLHGLDAQIRHRMRLRRAAGDARRLTAMGACARGLWFAARYVGECLLVLGVFWYALLEVAGVVYSFKPQDGFYVIKKPQVRSAAVPGAPRLMAKKEAVG
jgi:egghead protein (zeste-white 4 protein)